MKTATMTAALDGHQNNTASGQPADAAISSTSPTVAGAENPARQTLDRWPFSLAVSVALSAWPVVKVEA